ncbi:cellulose binding domain-containing protein [Plantactinospora sp. KBS50]|uniref:cellulose binding domain-containing protein n=1 Tax=Plantactinospora sp. KBS50 TaxID=2024580 RepID=UPI000BAAD8FE|nr:cellulose binding domain-containing protein [Plantactinospora sp. KBS50]ASW54487.1 cellulose-binding protein [Plantactinospora sp. KBS50]
MLRRPLLSAILAALVVAAGTIVPAGSAMPAAIFTRVMPLGDSITGSPGCWRAILWNRLKDNGYINNVDFVGTLGPQGCGVPYDGDNEGHGGALVTTVADQDQLPPWLAATHPDVVLMHFGTNDVWSNRSTETILAAYSKLVDQMRASNPSMKILVAKILPMAPSNCAECGQRVVALNDAIPGWAASKTTPGSPIVVVDQWTGFSTAADTDDGVHPNATGDQKMSDRWYPALTAALSGSVTPSPTIPGTPTPTPTTGTPTPTPTTGTPTPSPTAPAGACAATYQRIGEWQGGFQGEVTVRNNGGTASHSWTAQVSFGAGQQISQAWSAQVSQSGGTATAHSVDWNGSIAPAGSTTFGFIGTWTGSNPAPTVSCTLG